MNSINRLIEAMRDKFAQNYEADVSSEMDGLTEIARGSEAAFSTLIDCLKTDPGFLLQQAIAQALVSVGTKHSVASLMETIGDSQEKWELRNLLIQLLGEVLAETTDYDSFANQLVEIMHHQDAEWQLRCSAIDACAKSRDKSILTAICALLDDREMYRSAGRVIEAVKESADADIVSLIHDQLEALHQEGVPVRIAQAERIDLPILDEIRSAHPCFFDSGEVFPHFRLGIVKGEFLTLDQLTKEFGLGYFFPSFRKIDRTEAEEMISRDLAHGICFGEERMPLAQSMVLARGFLECLNAEKGDEQTVCYYTGSNATFGFLDRGVMIIGNHYAGCIWFACDVP
jgi:hypothetical protein